MKGAVRMNPGDAVDPMVPDRLPADVLAFSLRDAARVVGLGERTLADLVRAGKIKSVRVERRILVPRFALEDWLRGNAAPWRPAEQEGM